VALFLCLENAGVVVGDHSVSTSSLLDFHEENVVNYSTSNFLSGACAVESGLDFIDLDVSMFPEHMGGLSPSTTAKIAMLYAPDLASGPISTTFDLLHNERMQCRIEPQSDCVDGLPSHLCADRSEAWHRDHDVGAHSKPGNGADPAA
jgi:hypothetical protein